MSAFSLRELQTQFQNRLLRKPSLIENEIISTKKVPVSLRLDIYGDGYYLRLLEILQMDYPALHTLLGDERFDALGRKFISACPSNFRSVRWFGNQLANFMRTTQPYCEQPILIELAEFEWLLADAFDARNSKVISLEDMTNISANDWPALSFKVHPSLRRINLYWNAVPVWKVVKEESDPIPFEQTEIPSSWVIWRKKYETKFLSLPVDEAYFLDAMIKGENFSSICEGLLEWIDEQNVGMHAATLLKRYILDEMVAGIS